MECVRRAVAVELKRPPPELSAVEEPYRRIVEEVAAYVAEEAGEGEVQRAVPKI
jgi:putative transposase